MALNIPMPDLPGTGFLKGIDTGSSMFTRMIQPVLEREKQRQQAEQFAQELEIKKQQLAKSGANADLQRQLLEQHILQAKHANDPMYEFNQFKNLMGMMSGGSGGQMGGAQGGGQLPQMPSQEMGQGMGMFSPEGLGQAQQGAPQAQPQAQGGEDASLFEALKTNPMLRGFFKKKFGFDPLAQAPQTPEEKQAAQIDLFNQKEAIKQKNKVGSGETLTNTIKTKYQNVIGGASSAKPILRKLIQEVKQGKVPGQVFGAAFKRDAQASYKGEISTLLDGIRNAYTIPNTDSGTEKAEDKVLRKAGESDDNYAKRLQTILDQIEAREKDANVKLGAGNITAGRTVHLVGPNGEDYDVPESEVDAILQENPGVRRG